MPRKPPRSQRRGRPRPQARPPAGYAAPRQVPPAPLQPAEAVEGATAPTPVPSRGPTPIIRAPESAERQVTRAAARPAVRDYTYVRRELRRVLILASVIIVTLVVLSFFLP